MGSILRLLTILFPLALRLPKVSAGTYPWGVTLYGMQAASDVLDPATKAVVEKFVSDHNNICARDYDWLRQLQEKLGPNAAQSEFISKALIKCLLDLGKLDYCGAMGTAFLEEARRHPEQITPEAKAVIDRASDWVVYKQSRLPDGTFCRDGTGGTIWPDDLYMGAVFLVHYAQYTGEDKYLTDAANQVIHQAGLQKDTDGLWFHGYMLSTKKTGPCKWGRANGWAYVTMVEVLSAMKDNDPLRPQLLDLYHQFTETLLKVQTPSGRWRQLLDVPDSWEETSCSAMFVYGIARGVHRGWLPSEDLAMARKGLAGIASQVDPQGLIHEVCQGTNIGVDAKYYLDRPRSAGDHHGPGPVLLAAAEVLLHGSPLKN